MLHNLCVVVGSVLWKWIVLQSTQLKPNTQIVHGCCVLRVKKLASIVSGHSGRDKLFCMR